MKQLIPLLLFLTFAFTACTHEPAPAEAVKTENQKAVLENCLNFKFDKAIAFVTINPYVYERGGTNKIEDLKDSISIQLNDEQLKLLNDVLAGKYKNDSNDNSGADCFNPRHHVFFLKNDGTVLQYISVCFECNNKEFSIANKADIANLEMFFNLIQLPSFIDFYKHLNYYKPKIKSRAKN
ncbi:MAG: hypothetical protein IPP64_10470 [Bacteroidetes bacterium]|nr:hypothetical protein [Bacteroidota bacterium]